MIPTLKYCYARSHMISRIVLFSAVSLVAAPVLAGCGSTDADQGKESVVAAFYPIAYAVEQIAGGAADVRNLTPAGAEPHDLELTAGDVEAVHDGDVVFYLGQGFMPGLEKAVESRDGGSVDLLEGRRLRPGPAEDGSPIRDPHVWLDPARYAAMARAIGKTLGNEAAADRFAARLARLDNAYRHGLANCKRRQIVTSHAAFGYLAQRYGLEQVPLEGLSPEAEPSARGIEQLVELVRSSGTTTVFFETLISPRLAETVAREAGVTTAVLDPLEGLTDDRLARGADYFTVMRDNLAALQKGLGCARA